MGKIKGCKLQGQGFTIVELLIVIVVIGILAAITIVAYNGVQRRATASSLSSALSQAKNKLELYKVDNGSYPATGNLASAGITDGGVSYQYTSGGADYCLTATSGTMSYKASSTTAPSSGGCAGHGQGGVAAITNLVLDPTATGSSWLSPIVSGVTRSIGVSWNGKTNWSRFVWNGSGATTSRLQLNLADLTNGETYTSSFLVGNDGGSAVTISMDFCDMNLTNYTINPGEQKRIYLSASRSVYDSTFRFVDMNINTANATGVLIADGMVTKGSSNYNFANGNSPDWIWNGTANNSTSTGPVL